MKLRMIAAIAGAFALSLAACAKKAEEPADAGATAAEESGATTETAPADASSEAMTTDAVMVDAGVAKACVMDVAADAVCTMDLNACGKSSACNCGEGYVYDAALGKCLLAIDGVATATAVALDDSECAKVPAGVCTKDINVCGQPSSCDCDEGFAWNPVAGKCVKDLAAATP